MMKDLLILCMCLVVACTHATAKTDPTLQKETVRVGGIERVYYWKRPAGTVRAVVLAFHGGGGDPRKFDYVSGNFGEAATAAGFAVVYPEGLDRQWNDGRLEIAKGQDDLGFFDALLQDLGQRLALPVQRVFATGLSNGGLMSFRLACERSEKLLAIAPVGAGLGRALAARCVPKEAVSIVQFFGSKDPIMPYAGGKIDVPFSFKDRGEVLSQEATWEFWQKANHCKAQETDVVLPPKDGDFAVNRVRWRDCPAGVEGEHYLVVGAGHTWPGGAPYLTARLVGAVSKTLVANAVILKFFEKHMRP